MNTLTISSLTNATLRPLRIVDYKNSWVEVLKLLYSIYSVYGVCTIDTDCATRFDFEVISRKHGRVLGVSIDENYEVDNLCHA